MLTESPPAAIKRRRFTTMDATSNFATVFTFFLLQSISKLFFSSVNCLSIHPQSLISLFARSVISTASCIYSNHSIFNCQLGFRTYILLNHWIELRAFHIRLNWMKTILNKLYLCSDVWFWEFRRSLLLQRKTTVEKSLCSRRHRQQFLKHHTTPRTLVWN